MDKSPILNDIYRRAFQLSLAIYRLTNLFPKGEVLTNQIREIANQITAEVLTPQEISDKISKIIVYLQIAQAQNWLKPLNFEILIREYQRLKIEKEREKPKAKKQSRIKYRAKTKKQEISERQKKILAYLQAEKSAKMKDFLDILRGEVTERTLRSDLKFLINQGLIKKQGHFKTTRYFL